MGNPFRGRFEAKVDQKGRLSLPKGVLTAISSKNSHMVLTNSQFKGFRNLDVYPQKEWSQLEARIARLSPLKAEVQDFQRFYLAGGQEVEPDGQNRILVPAPLRKYAGISSQVVVVGMGHKFEIWAAEVWNHLYDQLASGFESTLATIANLDAEKE